MRIDSFLNGITQLPKFATSASPWMYFAAGTALGGTVGVITTLGIQRFTGATTQSTTPSQPIANATPAADATPVAEPTPDPDMIDICVTFCYQENSSQNHETTVSVSPQWSTERLKAELCRHANVTTDKMLLKQLNKPLKHGCLLYRYDIEAGQNVDCVISSDTGFIHRMHLDPSMKSPS